jgi:4-hydroxy-3-methylbut-2-enyl diphosphate reductase
MKSFDIPHFYKSKLISSIKEIRRIKDPRKKDFSPSILDFGPVRFFMARHFGFCYGVENAIEISYKAIEENPDKKIYLLSQMIHNPGVNADLQQKGARFIMDTSGKQLLPWEEIKADDIVIIPAFGTTLKIEEKLNEIGLEIRKYDTTCPFVERVWKKSEKLGLESFSVIIHGKYNHEETRATFSRSEMNAPSIIIKDMHEAELLGDYIKGNMSKDHFTANFSNRCSAGFDPEVDLERLGVINQTTMLATETQTIAEYFKNLMIEKYGGENIGSHFADTRDTLCYATNENQEATYGLLKYPADLAFVVGGYNSSNTSHLVELCEEKLPTYFISSADEIVSKSLVQHFNFREQKKLSSENYIPQKTPIDIIITSGASCPDAVVEEVLFKLLSYFENTVSIESVMDKLESNPAF